VTELAINFNKTHYISFTAGNNSHIPETEIAYDSKQIATTSNATFLGVYIDDRINWECHIEYIGSKLSTVCYMRRAIKPYTSINTMKKVYYPCFNSIMQYGLIFWGNSPPEYKNP
jgi:hypothetical protein